MKGAATLSALIAARGALGADQTAKTSEAFDIVELSKRNSEEPGFSYKFFDNNTMIAALYEMPAGGIDTQTPHGLDELYVVMKGRATLLAGERKHVVKAGAVLFVKAGQEHRFVEIEEDLQILIIYPKADPNDVPFYAK